MLLEIITIFHGGYLLLYNSHLSISLDIMTEKKGKSTKELEQLRYLNMKMQEVTLNAAITQKNEKSLCQTIAKYIRDPRDLFK